MFIKLQLHYAGNDQQQASMAGTEKLNRVTLSQNMEVGDDKRASIIDSGIESVSVVDKSTNTAIDDTSAKTKENIMQLISSKAETKNVDTGEIAIKSQFERFLVPEKYVIVESEHDYSNGNFFPLHY
jgi:hypothetical protein